jgi:hypothetical protein
MKSGIALILFVCAINSHAQDRRVKYAEGTLAIGKSQGSLAFAYHYGWKIGKKERLELGTGLRLTSYFGQNKNYRTAPAKLTSGSTGPGVIFTEDIPANIDTFFISAPNSYMLNLMITINYRLTTRWQAGFNIDAIGYSFGSSRSGTYINGTTSLSTTAHPTPFNLLLISENDLGSLNSEMYVRYSLGGPWLIKLAYQLVFTEYTTETAVQTYPEPNDRFRNKASMLSLGAVFQF